MDRKLRVLVVEDNAEDAELALRELKSSGFTVESAVVRTAACFREKLQTFAPDMILSDFSMPGFGGIAALEIARTAAPDTPFVFVSGTIGEERAIEVIKHGATDYVLKQHLPRLGNVVRRAMQEAEERRARQRAEQELRRTKDQLQGILASMRDVVCSMRLDDEQALFVNDAIRDVYGREPEELFASRTLMYEVVHPEDRAEFEAAWADLRTGSGRFDRELRIRRPDGSTAWVHKRARVIRDTDEAARIDVICTDITTRKLQEQHILRLSRIHAVLSGINALIVRARDRRDLLDGICQVLTVTGGFRLACIAHAGESAEALEAVDGWSVADEATRECLAGFERGARAFMRLASTALAWGHDFILHDIGREAHEALGEEAAGLGLTTAAAFPIVVETRIPEVLVLFSTESGVFSTDEQRLVHDLVADIGYALASFDKADRLDYLARYDPLTGALSRAGLTEDLQAQIDQAIGAGMVLPLVILNVGHLAQINESFGRHQGDLLLKAMARRIRDLPEAALGTGRVGPDHFAVIGSPVAEDAVAVQLCDRLLEAFAKPFVIGGNRLHFSPRAGVAIAPEAGRDADELLVHATAAMRAATRQGVASLRYEPAMTQEALHRVTLENRLREAVREQQFVLHYQPKVDARTGRPTGAEALLRWQTEDGGWVPPTQIIPVLEDTGLIVEVGNWVMRRACEALRALRGQGMGELRIAVNVSPLQLRQPGFIEDVRRLHAEDAATAAMLDLEITENMIMDGGEEDIARLHALRDLGMHIAVDDFGTGYSSLSMLSRLPITTIKIDRSFVVNMTQKSGNLAVVAAIITLAHALDLHVVAEGVDTMEQFELLRRHGCDEIQGYLFSRPTSLDDLILFVGARC